MDQLLMLFTVAGRLLAAPTAQVRGLQRRDEADSAGVQLVELRRWLGYPDQGAKAILVRAGTEQIGLVVDTVVDLEVATTPLPLPPLLGRAGHDPAVRALYMAGESLALVIDLELLARRLCGAGQS